VTTTWQEPDRPGIKLNGHRSMNPVSFLDPGFVLPLAAVTPCGLLGGPASEREVRRRAPYVRAAILSG
jgi:hypothetical protein